MEALSVKNLDFQYEAEESFALRQINVGVQRGEMVLFCGPCGCGKTTLFRLLKEELRPSGSLKGTITMHCDNARIGYLFQNPDSQLVCQTVEEELVFGAENIGMLREEMARAVAELAAYLGIEGLLHKKTAALSGGQKQMVNLASLLLMKPKLLLLDEPVSQLDPVSTCEFIQLLRKLREELDLTILIIEHHLDAFLKEADRVVYMEEGSIAYDGEAQGLLQLLLEEKPDFVHSIPETVRLYAACADRTTKEYPLTVKELVQGVDRLQELQWREERECIQSEELVQIKSGYFRYERTAPDILKNVKLTLGKGGIYALIGGNGAGKSTLFSVLSGYRKLYRGKCIVRGKVGVLPQNPVYAFFKDVLMEDFTMTVPEEKVCELMEQYEFCAGIRPFLTKNPLDLSGGQMQKAAIVKMLLHDADILLMDEPVKAMDGYEKYLFARLLEELKVAGKTIFFISHDLEFVERVADECLLMFDGAVIARQKPEQMFEDNRFYTTVGGRIRGMIRDE